MCYLFNIAMKHSWGEQDGGIGWGHGKTDGEEWNAGETDREWS